MFCHSLFLSRVFLFLCEKISSTGPTGLKTLTHWMLNYIYFMIYFTLFCDDLSTILAFSEITDNKGEDFRMEKDSGLRRL